MKAEVEIGNKKYNVDFSKGIDISIPLRFNGEQPNTYGVDKATAKPYQDGQFVGDTRKGGPCNFETYSFTPHCNGTHTECIGHITDERIDILSSLNEEMIPATLISITPKSTNENYIPYLNNDDLVITKEDLELQLKDIDLGFLKGVVIRTLPNSDNCYWASLWIITSIKIYYIIICSNNKFLPAISTIPRLIVFSALRFEN